MRRRPSYLSFITGTFAVRAIASWGPIAPATAGAIQWRLRLIHHVRHRENLIPAKVIHQVPKNPELSAKAAVAVQTDPHYVKPTVVLMETTSQNAGVDFHNGYD